MAVYDSWLLFKSNECYLQKNALNPIPLLRYFGRSMIHRVRLEWLALLPAIHVIVARNVMF